MESVIEAMESGKISDDDQKNSYLEGELPAEFQLQYVLKNEVLDLHAIVSFLGTDDGRHSGKS